MKSRLVLVALLLASAGPASAERAPSPIHPRILPRTAAGDPAKPGEVVSAEATCRGCHDLDYITAHATHGPSAGAPTCFTCHVDGGALSVSATDLEDGRVVAMDVRVGPPSPKACARCHGVVSGEDEQVELPSAIETATTTSPRWSLTLAEGAIVSPALLADARLGLEGKAELEGPWDVHASKGVGCAECHHAANDPARAEGERRAPAHVKADPRTSIADFLVRPDHRLTKRTCRSCHEPGASHARLPYGARHLTVLACATCHIARPMGPTLELVDETIVGLDGAPVRYYRNAERRPGEPLARAALRPLRPLLVLRAEADGPERLAPVNVVTRYRWVSRSGARAKGAEAGGDEAALEIPPSAVRAALVAGDGFAPEVVAALDRDHDGALRGAELRLDTEAAAEVVAARLRAAGFEAPTIEGTMTVYPLAHGVSAPARALRACDECHAAISRASEAFPIVPFTPGGVAPRPAPEAAPLVGALVVDARGGLSLERADGAGRGALYVLGLSRHRSTNQLGFFVFSAVALVVGLHGLARLLSRLRGARHPAAPRPGVRVRVFGRYVRAWHWTMAGSGAFMIATGIAVHNAGAPWVVGLGWVVRLHNLFAVVLIVNAAVSLVYHALTRKIRGFIPKREGFGERVRLQLAYLSRGVFRGEARPPHGPGETLNPLQQITYVALLNVLFPLQIGTGAAIWAIGQWPALAAPLGGLAVVAPIHNLGAWLFFSFFVLHVYLVTTGRTVGEHLRTMVTGHRHVEHEPAGEAPSGEAS